MTGRGRRRVGGSMPSDMACDPIPMPSHGIARMTRMSSPPRLIRLPALCLCLCLALTGLALPGPAGAAPAGAAAGLLDAARAARTQAEAELAAFRAQQIEEHAALLDRVHAAQRALTAARDAVAVSADRLVAARRAAEDQAAAEVERQRAIAEVEALLADTADVPARLARLAESARVRVEPVELHDRAGRPATVPVLRLGARHIAAGDSPDTVGLVDGAPPRVGGPRFTPARAEAVRALARGEAAAAPIDFSGELTGAEPAVEWSLRRWLEAGGPFVWPILLLALAALVVAIDRAVRAAADRPPPRLVEAVCADLDRGAPDAARARVSPPRTALARVLDAGLADRGPGALEAALAAEDVRLDRGLRLLAVFAAVAPLLGLLGTVSGMIGTFDVIAVHGTGEPRLLSGGIAQALTTTQLGLMVAVPTLLAHAVLARLAERTRNRLEAAAARLAERLDAEEATR